MPEILSYSPIQIPLAEMERGLARPIATLRLEPPEISLRAGLRFEAAKDDLDELDAVLVRGSSGRQFALVRHRHQPVGGTDILTNERSPDFEADLRQVLDLLQFSPEELSWTHPSIHLAKPSRRKVSPQ